MEFPLPELGEGVYEAELVSWLVQVGETVKRGQNLMEVLTDKATMEVPSPFAGTISSLQAEPGQQIKVGDIILSYEPTGAPEPEPKLPVPTGTDQKQKPVSISKSSNGSSSTPPSVKAAPSVRLLARRLGIDLQKVPGSGPEGRILIEDLTSHMTLSPHAKEKSTPHGWDLGTPGTRRPLVGIRRKIAEQMVRSTHTIPHFSYIDECDLCALVHLRESLKETARRKEVKLTYLAFFVKAVVTALKEVPLVNSSLEGEELVLHDKYNIGIAVSTPQGLLVPFIHEADKKDLFQIAAEVEQLSHQARDGKIHREDLIRGTFTITSIGNIGGLTTTPIINHPEVGIMGIGKVVKRPVYDDVGQLKPAHMIYLSFSFDHRVVDGAIGALFGNAVIQQIHNPATLLVTE